MNPRDPNIQLVEVVAQALGELCDELVLVGGCAAGLLCTSPSAPPPRVTYDVDVVAEVAALSAYHALEKQFAKRGFVRDVTPEAPICRWRLGEVMVDLMPAEERILGFANRWYPLAIATASRITLSSGRNLQLISAPAFIATKLEAFSTRGNNDLMSSHDFEDIITVIDGRPDIVQEVVESDRDLLHYLAASFTDILRSQNFDNALPGLVVYDELYDERLRYVQARLKLIANLKSA